MKPHKHAEVIKAWADGAEIEFRNEHRNGWVKTTEPSFYDQFKYRVKNKHQSLMDAYAKGAKIEVKYLDDKWLELVTEPLWQETREYRIKPAHKQIRFVYASVGENDTPYFMLVKDLNSANVKFTFNGETNELISVEKI